LVGKKKIDVAGFEVIVGKPHGQAQSEMLIEDPKNPMNEKFST